jgi:hypothetical protein
MKKMAASRIVFLLFLPPIIESMIVAKKKKQNNIAEYIIYVWQNEDLIRSYEFDIERINNSVISFLPTTDEERLEIKKWYQALSNTLINEGLQVSGHSEETHQIIDELNTIHHFLLNIRDDEKYKTIYNKSADKIKEFKKLAAESSFNDVDICMNGLYGLLLLRLNNKAVSPELLTTIDGFGEIMGYLAFKYKEKNSGIWN